MSKTNFWFVAGQKILLKVRLICPEDLLTTTKLPEQAVVREVNEELNVSVVASEYLFSLPNKYEYSGWTIPTLDLFFLCKVKILKQ